MRILRLRGRNIASLTEFDIDFAGGLLSDAGVFAITGPTGAGKSSLLDALCLALFDRAPRAKGTRTSKVTSDAISEIDSRNCMRRKTPSALAEVSFEGAHGHRYRAQWNVGRAYGREDGALRKVVMTLDDLTTGASLTSPGKEQTLASIESALGLTYAQFCRTVLLAQGDFAQFLRSPANEKAQLLEHLTGTPVFSAVSRAAYRLAKERRGSLVALKERSAGLAHATPEALDLARRRLREQAAERARLEAEHAATQTALREAEALLRAQSECARLENDIREIELGQKKLDQEIEQRRAACVGARERDDAERVKAEECRERIRAARGLDENRTRLRTHRVARDKGLERLHREISGADAHLALLDTQLKQLSRASALELAERGGRGERAARDLAAAKVEKVLAPAATAEAAPWRSFLQSMAPPPQLQTHLRLVRKAVQDRVSGHDRLEQIELRGKEVREHIARTLSSGLAPAFGLTLADIDTRDPRAALRALEEARVRREARIALLSNAVARAEKAAALFRERDALLQERTAGLAEERRLENAVVTGRLDVSEREAEVRVALQMREIAAKRADLLRSGKPCPLCGSLEHPLAGTHAGGSSHAPGEGNRGGAQDPAEILEAQMHAVSRRVDADAATHAKLVERLALGSKRSERLREDESLLRAEAERDGIPLLAPAGTLAAEQRDLLAAQAQAELLAPRFNELAELRVSYKERKEGLDKAIADLRATLDTQEKACAEDRARTLEAHGIAHAERARLEEEARAEGLVDADLAGKRASLALDEDLDAEEKGVQARLNAARASLEAARNALAEGDASLAQLQGQRHEKGARATALALEIERRAAVVFPLETQAHGGAETGAEPALEQSERHVAALRDRFALERRASLERSEGTGRLREQVDLLASEASRREGFDAEILSLAPRADRWAALSNYIGSEKGDKFRSMAQGITLVSLLESTNETLARLCPRYRLVAVEGEMDVLVSDMWMGDEPRGVGSLSGGETFLVSLALALGLCSLSSRNVFLGTLFIDEGFGTLDPATLETTLTMLDALQAEGRQVGLISHVPGLAERLAARIVVTPVGHGASRVSVEE